MSYTIKERNEAVMLIAAGKADLNNIAFYEDLESFNWIVLQKQDGVINNVQLTYAGKDLNRRLLKNTIL
jgi:hypothetical protein